MQGEWVASAVINLGFCTAADLCLPLSALGSHPSVSWLLLAHASRPTLRPHVHQARRITAELRDAIAISSYELTDATAVVSVAVVVAVLAVLAGQ